MTLMYEFELKNGLYVHVYDVQVSSEGILIDYLYKVYAKDGSDIPLEFLTPEETLDISETIADRVYENTYDAACDMQYAYAGGK